MDRRGQERDLGIPINYNPPQIIQESPVKLPLAPILSTPPDRIRGNAMASTRRGSAIFSPTQTLDPPPPEPAPDADLPASNTKTIPPPPEAAAGATTSNTTIRYRECLKNHAAGMGGHIVDGCGEFMPSGEEGLEALRCAACDCHRNFHRKEVNGRPPPSQYQSNNNNSSRSPLLHTSSAPPNHKRSHSFATSPRPPTMVNFSGGAAAESSSEDLNEPSKKRFRTKFSQDQKARMHEFASKIEWRLQKQNEQEVQEFCSEVGVKKQVFKVWMHNNKQAMKKKEM